MFWFVFLGAVSVDRPVQRHSMSGNGSPQFHHDAADLGIYLVTTRINHASPSFPLRRKYHLSRYNTLTVSVLIPPGLEGSASIRVI